VFWARGDYLFNLKTSFIINLWEWFAAATLGSFVIALVHFSLELFIYETLTISTAIQPLVIASISSLWMGAGWNYYTKHALAPG
jgi:hypothetical protein